LEGEKGFITDKATKRKEKIAIKEIIQNFSLIDKEIIFSIIAGRIIFPSNAIFYVMAEFEEDLNLAMVRGKGGGHAFIRKDALEVLIKRINIEELKDYNALERAFRRLGYATKRVGYFSARNFSASSALMFSFISELSGKSLSELMGLGSGEYWYKTLFIVAAIMGSFQLVSWLIAKIFHLRKGVSTLFTIMIALFIFMPLDIKLILVTLIGFLLGYFEGKSTKVGYPWIGSNHTLPDIATLKRIFDFRTNTLVDFLTQFPPSKLTYKEYFYWTKDVLASLKDGRAKKFIEWEGAPKFIKRYFKVVIYEVKIFYRAAPLWAFLASSLYIASVVCYYPPQAKRGYLWFIALGFIWGWGLGMLVKYIAGQDNAYPATLPYDANIPDREPTSQELLLTKNAFGKKLKFLQEQGIDIEKITLISPSLEVPAKVKGGLLYVNPNILRGPPEQLRVIFEGHEFYHLLGYSEEQARQKTIEYLKQNNLLKSHIDFLERNNIELKADEDWLQLLVAIQHQERLLTLLKDIKNISGRLIIASDIDKTILDVQDSLETFKGMKEIILKLLCSGVIFVFISGNSVAEQMVRIVEPLEEELRKIGEIKLLKNVILYANGGASRVAFDDRGNKIREDIIAPIPQNDLDTLVEISKDVLSRHLETIFGYKNTFYEPIAMDVINNLVSPSNMAKFYKKKIKFELQVNKKEPEITIVRDVYELVRAKYYPDKSKGLTISFPYIEIRDNQQASIILVFNLSIFDKRLKDVRSKIIDDILSEMENRGLKGKFFLRTGGVSSIDITYKTATKKESLEHLKKKISFNRNKDVLVYLGDEFYRKGNKEGNDVPVLGVDDIYIVSVAKDNTHPGLTPLEKQKLLWAGEGPKASLELMREIEKALSNVSSPINKVDYYTVLKIISSYRNHGKGTMAEPFVDHNRWGQYFRVDPLAGRVWVLTYEEYHKSTLPKYEDGVKASSSIEKDIKEWVEESLKANPAKKQLLKRKIQVGSVILEVREGGAVTIDITKASILREGKYEVPTKKEAMEDFIKSYGYSP
ncbi:hypothetical protein DRP98_09430, partial [candidate division KSB1 bacterium]